MAPKFLKRLDDILAWVAIVLMVFGGVLWACGLLP